MKRTNVFGMVENYCLPFMLLNMFSVPIHLLLPPLYRIPLTDNIRFGCSQHLPKETIRPAKNSDEQHCR